MLLIFLYNTVVMNLTTFLWNLVIKSCRWYFLSWWKAYLDSQIKWGGVCGQCTATHCHVNLMFSSDFFILMVPCSDSATDFLQIM